MKGKNIDELVNKIIETTVTDSHQRMALDLNVQLWHSFVVPGLYVVIEYPANIISYGEILEPGNAGTSEVKNAESYEREKLAFSHELLADYRLVNVFSNRKPEGEHKVIHVGMIILVITKAGWSEIKTKGWPNDLSFAKQWADMDWWAAINSKLNLKIRDNYMMMSVRKGS